MKICYLILALLFFQLGNTSAQNTESIFSENNILTIKNIEKGSFTIKNHTNQNLKNYSIYYTFKSNNTLITQQKFDPQNIKPGEESSLQIEYPENLFRDPFSECFIFFSIRKTGKEITPQTAPEIYHKQFVIPNPNLKRYTPDNSNLSDIYIQETDNEIQIYGEIMIVEFSKSTGKLESLFFTNKSVLGEPIDISCFQNNGDLVNISAQEIQKGIARVDVNYRNEDKIVSGLSYVIYSNSVIEIKAAIHTEKKHEINPKIRVTIAPDMNTMQWFGYGAKGYKEHASTHDVIKEHIIENPDSQNAPLSLDEVRWFRVADDKNHSLLMGGDGPISLDINGDNMNEITLPLEYSRIIEDHLYQGHFIITPQFSTGSNPYIIYHLDKSQTPQQQNK